MTAVPSIYKEVLALGSKKCSRCDYSTTTTDRLKSHMKRCLESTELYECQNCGYKSGTEVGLRVHFKNIHPDSKFSSGSKKCSRCDYRTSTMDRLNSHTMRCLESNELFTCESCGFKSGTSYGLTVHFKNSHPGQKFHSGSKKCTRCDYSTSTNEQLNKHMKQCLLSDELFYCEHCEYKSGSKLGLGLHIKKSHADMLFQCGNCDFTTQKLNQFEFHSKMCTVSICFVCDYTTPKRQEMKDHLFVEHDITKFDCDLCSKQFKEMLKLTLHVNAVHLGKKDFGCTICNFTTGWPNSLRNHMKSEHVKVEPKNCDQENCDFIGYKKDELRNHLNVVHGIKEILKFKCEKCDYRAKTKEQIDKHLKCCGELQQCQECELKFGTKLGLGLHMKFDHPELFGKIDCSNCDYKACTSQHLKSHLKNCLKSEEFFNCEVCDLRFGTVYSLTSHFKKQHPNQKRFNNSVSDNGGFKCTKCDYQGRQANRLERHWIVCNETVDLLECEHCEKKFGTTHSLASHFKNQHPGQIRFNNSSSVIGGFQCTKCDYQTISAGNLDRHWIICNETKDLLKCEHCDKQFGTAPSFTSHSRKAHPERSINVQGKLASYPMKIFTNLQIS